jgi:hypothetical protein
MKVPEWVRYDLEKRRKKLYGQISLGNVDIYSPRVLVSL